MHFKMHFQCVLMLIFVISDDSLGFDVRGPSGPLVVPLGGSAILPCYVETPLEEVKVVWKRTDSETLVHLYQDGESRPEAQHKDYHHRAHFFTDQIQHGNFSLLLENVRAEDEGVYRCKVYSQQLADKTLVEIKHVELLIVSGSDRSVSAYDGEDVTLSCSVDSHITPEHIEEVSWRKTDGDILVLLFQNNKTLSDSSDERYRGRAELFTAEIPKGNFSLRLKSVRTEDKGVYMCHVFAGGLSANATVVLVQLGFSSWHIAVLFFCFAAGSGAVLLLCSLIYCRSKNTDTSSIIWTLQVSLVFCPNICMFLAFMLWGFTEGSLHETVTCCALYILRPVMLIWALRYLKYLQDNHKSWIRFFRITHELTVLTVIVYSVLFAYGWGISAHDTDNGRRISSGMFFVFVVLSSPLLSKVMRHSSVMRTELVDCMWFFALWMLWSFSFFQLYQLISSFGLPSPVFVILPYVQPLMLCCIPVLTRLQARFECFPYRWITVLWIIIITLLDIILVIYAHVVILEREKEYLEWICVILFLEVLKITVFFENCVLKRMLKDLTDAEILTEEERSRVRRRRQTETSQQGLNTLPLCNEIMFMFGAVGLVLLNSVTLTAELILKARNGERVLKDMRVIVFPSESVFVLYWLILQMHAYLRIVTTGSTHNQNNSHQRGQLMVM
uniref:Ig-like domain-containing protein n=1 Tax=Cyprinus carpio TaxID=7962 RepID=A0A8C1SV34_CYPCA